jgi:hypothetical protein|tara:strand:- start:1603 stop:1887 length:285 start_codon:yes stop_codon:yes gene_type:complete
VRVEKFLNKDKIEDGNDLATQVELWAYTIAKHYGISLFEVYSMPPNLFKQSLVWAMVGTEEKKKQNEHSKKQAKAGDKEMVKLDYSFLDWEDAE